MPLEGFLRVWKPPCPSEGLLRLWKKSLPVSLWNRKWCFKALGRSCKAFWGVKAAARGLSGPWKARDSGHGGHYWGIVVRLVRRGCGHMVMNLVMTPGGTRARNATEELCSIVVNPQALEILVSPFLALEMLACTVLQCYVNVSMHWKC